MINVLRKLRRDERGTTVIEYGLIAFFISISVVAGGSVIGDEINNIFSSIEIGTPQKANDNLEDGS